MPTGSGAQARAWANGEFDAVRGFGPNGVGHSAHWSRVRCPSGVEVAGGGRRGGRRPCCAEAPAAKKKARG
jgi:hypothetical protein